MSLYMVSIIARMPVHAVVGGVMPFFIPLLLSLIVVTVVPAASTWLPQFLKQ
jgi:TRAP-type C4-dicarboxylate transport system permease large subunit